jgi:transposase-like protein
MTATCSRCGRSKDTVTDPTQRLAWVSEHDQGHQTWLCHTCARTHVRDLESKLPVEYW